MKIKTSGPVQVIVTTPEQLFHLAEGHLMCLGSLIHNHCFCKRIRAIVVDKIHLLYTCGIPLHGLDAFRPVYGRLNEIKALFGQTPWLLLTATPPTYMLKTIESKVLSLTYICISVSSNCPNTTYATHCIDDIKNWDNYKCFICQPFDLVTQPCVLIFIQSAEGTV